MRKDASTGLLYDKRKMSLAWVPIVIMAIIVSALQSFAAVTVHNLFDNNMVLQRDIPIPVYGTGTAGEAVTVEISGPQANAKVNGVVGSDGKWILYLPKQLAASSPHTLKINAKTLTNVLIGDVWICGGQSNMEGNLDNESSFDAPSLNNKNIRILKLKIWYDDEKWNATKTNPTGPDYGPQESRDIFHSWTEVKSGESMVSKFSTAGLVLAREIATATGVPIGLMQNAMGGTCIEAWTPQDYFNYPLGKKIVADYYLLRKTWSGQDKTGKPQDEPSILYNSLMHPFTKFGIKGFYWWQGEHNTNTWDYDLKNGDNYRYVLPIFIKAMREKFSNAAKDFPVMIMQIHPYGNTTQLGQSELAHVRAGQWHASMTVPNVGVSVSHDIQPTGTETIHPSNREKYAMRAANVVLGKWYGKANPTQPSGMVSTTITGSKAIIECTAGLKLKTKDGQAPKMFVLMDNAGKMHSATATLVGDTKIEVSANGVSSIKEVRYAFSDIPSTNLVNSNDIPLSTFRFIVGETEPTVSNSIPRSKKKLELARPAAGNIYYQLNGRLVHGSVVQSSKHSFSSGFFVNKSSTSFVLMRSGE